MRNKAFVGLRGIWCESIFVCHWSLLYGKPSNMKIYFFLYRLGHSFCTRGDQGSSSRYYLIGFGCFYKAIDHGAGFAPLSDFMSENKILSPKACVQRTWRADLSCLEQFA